MKVFHLFRPIDEIVAKRKAAKLKQEAFEISYTLLEEIISSLPLEGEVWQHTSLCTEGKAGGDNREELGDKAVKSNKEDMAEAESQLGMPSRCYEVSDEEREADRDIRHRIFLGLLRLACAMVSLQEVVPDLLI